MCYKIRISYKGQPVDELDTYIKDLMKECHWDLIGFGYNFITNERDFSFVDATDNREQKAKV